MPRRADLDALAAALRGDPPRQADWLGVLKLANDALVTPQMHAAAERCATLARLPEEAQVFTREVVARNRERNRRLLGQLGDALAVLNGAGIEPVLLKGAALWATLEFAQPFDRMLNDLDLLVRPHEAPRAQAALMEAGFDLLHAYPGPQVHVAAELARASDVGSIDLHQRPPGPPGLAESPALESRRRPLAWRGLKAWVPDPAAQIFILVLHDQFHDGDYWRGGFTLRHLLDIAVLASRPEAPDWPRLASLARTRLAAHALGAELAAARRLAGAAVPRDMTSSWATLQHARHMAQFAHPRLVTPLAGLGVISEWPSVLAHRASDRRDHRRLFGTPPSLPLTRRLERMRHILGGFADGKI